MENVLVSIPEACKALSIKRSSIYRLIDAKQLATVKIGRRTLIPVASIRALAGENADA
jgi:excisionase family DNA binding protein